MSKQQRDAIDAALRAEPFGINQSTDGHRKTFDAFAVRPYPADVAAADVTLGGVGAIELTVAGHPADPTVLYFHGGGYVAGSARDRGWPQPAAVAVFSPWADISRSGASMRTKDGADPLFSYDAMGWYAGRDDVDVTLQVAPEGTHVFQLHFGALDEADEALDEVARFFTRHLSATPRAVPV